MTSSPSDRSAASERPIAKLIRVTFLLRGVHTRDLRDDARDEYEQMREAMLDALSCQHNPGLCDVCREELLEALGMTPEEAAAHA